MFWWCVGAAVWALCGAISYAVDFANFQRSFPSLAEEDYRRDMGLAVALGLTGPVGLIVGLLASGFAEHGLKWR